MFDVAVGKEPGQGMQLLLGYMQIVMLTTRGVGILCFGFSSYLALRQPGLPLHSTIFMLLCFKVYLPVH